MKVLSDSVEQIQTYSIDDALAAFRELYLNHLPTYGHFAVIGPTKIPLVPLKTVQKQVWAYRTTTIRKVRESIRFALNRAGIPATSPKTEPFIDKVLTTGAVDIVNVGDLQQRRISIDSIFSINKNSNVTSEVLNSKLNLELKFSKVLNYTMEILKKYGTEEDKAGFVKLVKEI